MNSEERLLEMASVPRAHVSLAHYHWSNPGATDAWQCSIEIDQPDMKLRRMCYGPTPDAAVENCYHEWQRLYRSGLDEAKPTLLARSRPSEEPVMPAGPDTPLADSAVPF